MQTASNVSAAKPKVTGAMSVAPAGTTVPTNAVAELAEAFKNLGYTAEDGLVNSGLYNPTWIKAWGGDDVLPMDDDNGRTYKIKLIEVTNVDVLKFVFGDENVSGTFESGIDIKVNGDGRTEHAIVFDMILRDGALKRIVIPKGVIRSIGDITYQGNNAIAFEVTVKANKDSSGNDAYEYITGATGVTGVTGATGANG